MPPSYIPIPKFLNKDIQMSYRSQFYMKLRPKVNWHPYEFKVLYNVDLF